MRSGRWLLACLVVAFAAACGSDAPDERPVESAPTTTITVDDLEGRTFVSGSVEGRELEPGTTISLSFAEQRISAIAGCSTQNADVAVAGDRLEVASPMARTEPIMNCGEGRRLQDDWLAEFLTGQPTITLDGSMMVLTGGEVEIGLEARS